MSKVLILSMALCLFAACSCNSNIDNSTVKDLDQSRYLGGWYEIARFDHRFERGLEKCKALYTLQEDGKIDVTNTGMKNGQPKVAQGKAKTTDNPALLRVSFFGPFYSDYRVMMLGHNYEYALVGSKSAKYLWILSRTPQMEDRVKETILTEATRRGYDVSKLIWVTQ